MGYFNELKKFIAQADTDNLKTKQYNSEYRGTKVKVSFGQGNSAKIPWISFTIEPNTTSNGIYPVYLFYKEQNILILAYGISETNKPEQNWNLKNGQTINEYFVSNYDKKPDRYGDSYVYKVYNLEKTLDEITINQDLDEIIDQYLKVTSNKPVNSTQQIKSTNKKFNINEFNKSCNDAGLIFNPLLINRFVSSLLTKPFVILTGLSGSGKTKLAQAFVQWICINESQYRIIPVGADWTNREPLLGYPNALNPKEYVKPDNGALQLILHATKNPKIPHFMILDEMNLSHVERYFADFLSAMESKEEIHLYSGQEVENDVPQKLKLPMNLFIIGTVNIDETTNMFSPKVLDRANTIEFRISQNEMKKFLSMTKPIDMGSIKSQGVTMSEEFINLSKNDSYSENHREEIEATLIKFFDELQKGGAEFGYRSATEILKLIYQIQNQNSDISLNEQLDIAIMQKLLPKLHGSRRKLVPVLETLGRFCISESLDINKDVFENSDFEFLSENENLKYPLSLEKITRMYRGAIDNGFASYAEA